MIQDLHINRRIELSFCDFQGCSISHRAFQNERPVSWNMIPLWFQILLLWERTRITRWGIKSVDTLLWCSDTSPFSAALEYLEGIIQVDLAFFSLVHSFWQYWKRKLREIIWLVSFSEDSVCRSPTLPYLKRRQVHDMLYCGCRWTPKLLYTFHHTDCKDLHEIYIKNLKWFI